MCGVYFWEGRCLNSYQCYAPTVTISDRGVAVEFLVIVENGFGFLV